MTVEKKRPAKRAVRASQRDLDLRVASQAFGNATPQVFRVSGTEEIGQMFRFNVDFVVGGQGFDATQIVGAPVSLRFQSTGQQELRTVVGVISETSEWLDDRTGDSAYRITVSPRAQLLTLVTTQQVFLGKSIPEIIAEKLSLVDLDHRMAVGSHHAKREIVVQYAETDLAFITRLCEHYGISFFFEPRDQDHDQLVFTDDQSFRALPDPIAFMGGGEPTDVYRLERKTKMIPVLYMMDDYNYRTPMVQLRGVSQSLHGIGGALVEYGGHFKTPEEATRFAECRREESECRRIVYSGECDRPDVHAGVTLAIDHPTLGQLELLVTSCEHLVQMSSKSGSSTDGHTYRNRFKAVMSGSPFRPERRTPRPRIDGVISATVMPKPGSDGTQPWLDGDGRYVVRLLFDTADNGQKASHEVRMAQAHAGPDYGIHFPLRPGVEVLVAFIDGDPDRPIIVGSVPNPMTPTPVVDKHNLFHRIKTASGVKVEIEDGY